MLYSIAIELKNEVYIGKFPDLPNLEVTGLSMADVIANARLVVIDYLETQVINNSPIPEASEIHTHLMKPEYAGFKWAIINLNVNRVVDDGVEMTVKLSKSLYDELHTFIDNNDIDINTLVAEALKEKLR